MSVYTCIEHVELEFFLQNYSLGQLLSYTGIEAGIDNTHYFLVTSEGEFVLTLFEWMIEGQIDYFLKLHQHLLQAGFPCPQPQANNKGQLINQLANKPAILLSRIAGVAIDNPTTGHCQQIGAQLARLHCYCEDFPVRRTLNMDLQHCFRVAEKIKPCLKNKDYEEIIEELAFQKTYTQVKLPQGLIHADLFKDNVLFDNNQLTGVLDFYDACYDNFLTDVAITANDWCHEPSGEINRDKLASLLESYQQVRALTKIELEMLPVMLRLNALRFWLSRLEHQVFPRFGDLTQEKDPLLYRYILEQHQAM